MAEKLTKEQLLAEAMKLSPADRDDLAEMLYQGIPIEPDEPNWRQALHEIADALDHGSLKSIPAEAALRRLRERART